MNVNASVNSYLSVFLCHNHADVDDDNDDDGLFESNGLPFF